MVAAFKALSMPRESFVCIPEDQKTAEILLIYPDFAKNDLGTASYPDNHLGLNRLASYLDSKGHTVSILNTTGRTEGGGGPEQLASYLKENLNTFDIIGFHANSWNISHIIKVLEILRSDLNGRLILFGGPLPTAAPEKLLNLFAELGFGNLGLVQGYGEFLLEKIIDNSNDLSTIDGVWSYQNGVMNKGRLQRFSGEQMASLPFLNPKYNTFYQRYYKPFIEGAAGGGVPEGGKNSYGGVPEGGRADGGSPADGRPAVNIDTLYVAQGLDTNHGCPFNCSYCSVHIFGHAISEYSPQRVCDELEKQARETGFFMFTFTNSNLMFLRRDWIIEFCNEIIKRNMHEYISWSGYHHPNTINLLSVDDFKLLKKAGCDQIVVGIQSVEPKILEVFNRHAATYEIFKQITEKTAAADLELVIDYIRGVPGEDLSIVSEFYDYCVKNKIEVREFLLKIYPNTEIVHKQLDFSDYELIPITGNLAKDLDSFAVVAKIHNPKNSVLSKVINDSNNNIRRARKIRLGQNYIISKEQALELKDHSIPGNPFILELVKTAMIKMLELMLNPPKETNPFVNLSPEQMMKTLVMANENAAPLVKKMQEKLRKELGDEKFGMLKKKYES
jgi:radical SAM superfamily enzyme YgiQ (UPF0313 family)